MYTESRIPNINEDSRLCTVYNTAQRVIGAS